MRISLLITVIFTFTTHIFGQTPYKAQGTINPGEWTVLSDMSDPRNGHTTTYMSNGKVLVTGGYDGTQNLASAEIYEPATDTWTPTGNMDSVRFSHTATALDNGKVLIVGGWNGGSIDYKTTLLYDPSSGTFTHGPEMINGRSGHTATLLENGNVLIVGGYSNADGNTDMVEIYHPVSNTISMAASLNKGRSYHTAALVNENRVVVAAGFNPDYGFQMSSTEIYDVDANAWTELGDLSIARDYAASVYVEAENALFLIGGRIFNGFDYEGITSVEKLVLPGDSWTDFEDIPEPQSYIQAFPFFWFDYDVMIPSMIIPGGTNASGFGTDLTFSGTYAYDFVYEIWTEVPMFFHDRYYYAADQNESGEVIVTGGEGGGVEIFIPAIILNIANENIEQLNISPNPVTSYLNITLTDAEVIGTIEIYSITGIKIKQLANVNSGNNIITIDVSDLASGTYMVRAAGNKSTTSGTFIKN